jgi:hypothetical protein
MEQLNVISRIPETHVKSLKTKPTGPYYRRDVSRIADTFDTTGG